MSLLDKFSLRGKNALISSPEYVYGPEIAIGLAEAGANVWLCGECTKSLDEVAAQMEKAGYKAAGFLGKYTARCNCLAYGPLEGNDPKAFGDAIIRHSHIKRLAQADDVKAAAVFLASDASSFITGQTIAVDGGYTVK